MRTETGIVRTKEGNQWEFSMTLPKDLDEAVEVYGPNGVYTLLISALKVKLQNIAREAFRQGKERDEVDAAVASYRPGIGGRQSTKSVALNLILENRDTLNENPDLKAEVEKAFIAGKFGKVVELLS